MYIPKELQKENTFIDVAIPDNKSYFARIGEIQVPENQFTGDDVAAMNMDKIAQMEADYEAFANDPQFLNDLSHGE